MSIAKKKPEKPEISSNSELFDSCPSVSKSVMGSPKCKP